jgi:hypothetical protein
VISSTQMLAALAVSVSALAPVGFSAVVGPPGTAGPPPPLTAVIDGTHPHPLVPGGPPQNLDYTITNPGPAPQYATAVTIAITGITYTASAGTGTGITGANHPARGTAPGCSAADFTIVEPDALRQQLAVGPTSFTRSTARRIGTISMKNTGRNQNDCIGVTLALTVSVA